MADYLPGGDDPWETSLDRLRRARGFRKATVEFGDVEIEEWRGPVNRPSTNPADHQGSTTEKTDDRLDEGNQG